MAIAFAACTDERNNGFVQREEVFTPDSGSETSTPPNCGFRCSRDLKKVLKGCDGEEMEAASCAPEEGCGVDSCVDACTSAALSKGSIGCSFWTLPPDDADDGNGSCFAAMVANTWDHPVNITADWGADSLDISQSIYTAKIDGDDPVYTRLTGALPPGEVAIVFLAEAAIVSDPYAIRCPEGVKAAVDVDPIGHGTRKTKAFHLKTDVPVSAYSSFPYGGAQSYYPSSTLLLPVSSWDTTYIAVATGKYGDPQITATERRILQIVANEDDTEVIVRPNATMDEGIGIPAAGAGEIAKVTLSRGQVLQIAQRGGITGSPIMANKPVGLFGGGECAFLPSDVPWCDLTQQQIAPLSQWGTEYALVPFAPRIVSITGSARETIPWMFVGAADGTELSYDPARPPGAPTSLAAGQAVYFMTDQFVTVKSQDSKHPFYAGVHMTSAQFGGGLAGGGMTKGDPDFVNIAPTDQYLDRYVFFADYTYPDTVLTVIRRKTANGFMPVELACGGELTNFVPLGSKGEYEYAFVHLTDGSVPQQFANGECGYGRHEAKSEGPFSITVWGIGQDASYGFVGGVGSRPINDAPPVPVN